MNKGPMTEVELMQKARGLSLKFRGYPNKQDLVQEGILAYYESVNNGLEDVDRIITNMRKAMHTYANLKDRTVALPVSGRNYRLSKEISPEDYEKLSPAQKKFYETARSATTDLDALDDAFGGKTMGTEQGIALKQAFDRLPEAQKEVVTLCILYGYTHSQAADVMDKTRQRVSQLLKEAVETMQEAIM